MQWNIAPHVNAQRVHIGFFRVTVQGYQFVATCTCSTWSANFQTCTHSTVKHFLPLLWRKLPRRVQMIPVSVWGWGANTKGHFSGSVGPCSHCGGIKWSVMLPVTVPAQHEAGNKTSKPATGVIWIKTPCLFTKLVPLSYFLGTSERMCGAWNKAADRAELNTSGKKSLHTSGLWDFKINYLMSVFVVKLHEANLHWRNIN